MGIPESQLEVWSHQGSIKQSAATYHSIKDALETAKHMSSNQWFKPMVRVMKNIRSQLVDNGTLQPGIAPSYYLEGLLYNVPNEKFSSSYADSFVNTINWIQNEADKTKLVCANEQYYLIRSGMPTCWERADAQAFINASIDLWRTW